MKQIGTTPALAVTTKEQRAVYKPLKNSLREEIAKWLVLCGEMYGRTVNERVMEVWLITIESARIKAEWLGPAFKLYMQEETRFPTAAGIIERIPEEIRYV